jgi:hypothetical protein
MAWGCVGAVREPPKSGRFSKRPYGANVPDDYFGTVSDAGPIDEAMTIPAPLTRNATEAFFSISNFSFETDPNWISHGLESRHLPL